jgi:transcriptional regulator with XRE-family HTH domain
MRRRPYGTSMSASVAHRAVGPLVRDWRLRRGRSQMELALDAGVSPRHLSFVETGRSKPSPELLLMLAERLEVPLRERNTFLLAAGYAPRYLQTSLDEAPMARVRQALQHMLDLHDPYPGVVIDRLWNCVLVNRAAMRMVDGLPTELAGPPTNVFRACLHPEGLANRTLNFSDWAAYLLGQLHRTAVLTADPAVERLAAEVSDYPNVRALGSRRKPAAVAPEEPALLIPWRLRVGDAEHSYFTTLTTFGTPQDITLSELAVELFYPADDATDTALRTRE